MGAEQWAPADLIICAVRHSGRMQPQPLRIVIPIYA